MFTCTEDKLADVCLLHLQNVCDLAVGVIERFTQNIRSTFCGREFLKEHLDRELQCFSALGTESGIAAGVHRFGKPRADVSFVARVGRLSKIDAESCGYLGQECGWIVNRPPICR